MSPEPVVILGSGPAGLGAAYRLRRDRGVPVLVLEQAPAVGGCAGGFELEQIRCDFGSHRLHPSTPADVMTDIRTLLGADLLDRPRHGRIRLMGRWIHFPLKPADLLLRAHPRFALGVAADSLRKVVRGKAPAPDAETFATVLEAGLGRTICRQFYFPYAWKMWGQGPETLSPIQARKRVSAGSIGRMISRILGSLPGLKKPGQGRFFYPRQGFGQISRAYHQAAAKLGADFRLGARVTAVHRDNRGAHAVTFSHEGTTHTVESHNVWSTIPLTALVSMLDAPAPPAVIDAARSIAFRSMVLVYLVLPEQQFTEFDAHYFPEEDIPFTRLSEPKNYSASTDPRGTTVLCAEMPCRKTDPIWSMTDEALGQVVAQGLARAGIPLRVKPVMVRVRRIDHAYPVYGIGYERPFDEIDRWLLGVDGLVSFGRLGLFAHDNTHHALHMAYAAVECLRPDGTFDRPRWAHHRTDFQAHVVED